MQGSSFDAGQENSLVSSVATGTNGGKCPPLFAKIVLEISLRSMGKYLGGGGSSKSSDK